jgi:hypothetical protein
MSGSKLGWNHPVYSTWMEIPCMFSLSGSKLLDGIFLYVQLVCSSYLVQNLDGITLYVQLVQFKTFGWNLLVCSICQYFMSGSNFCIESSCMFNLSVFNVWYKILDGITLYVQLVCSSCLIQNFWIESS